MCAQENNIIQKPVLFKTYCLAFDPKFLCPSTNSLRHLLNSFRSEGSQISMERMRKDGIIKEPKRKGTRRFWMTC